MALVAPGSVAGAEEKVLVFLRFNLALLSFWDHSTNPTMEIGSEPGETSGHASKILYMYNGIRPTWDSGL
jgi:hypothetical protein